MKDLKFIKLLYFIAGAFILLAACKKKTDNITLPDQINSNPIEPLSSDTFTLITSSIREDTLVTDQMPYKLLGVMNDPNFGLSKSDFYSQFTITDLSAGFNTPGNTVDSVILTVKFTSKTAYYGNLLSSQTFSVHELTEAFPAGNAAIYSDKTLAYDPMQIGTFTGVVSLTDSVVIRENGTNANISPSLKFKLSAAFATKLITAPDGTYGSDASFKAFFKGIVIRAVSNPSTSEGAIIALTPNDIFSRITVYYNSGSQYNFKMSNARNFSNYAIVSQASAITNQKNNASIDYNQVYLQSLTGAKTKITIPYLKDLTTKNGVVIHKAELIVEPLAGSYTVNYPLPARLLVLQPDENNQSIAIPDLFTGRFNGNLTAANNYVLNVTDFIQFQLKKIQNGGVASDVLHLVIPSSDPIAPSRMIIDAAKSPNRKIRLKITYSNL